MCESAVAQRASAAFLAISDLFSGLWLATDADTKLVPCWHVGTRDGDAAMEFIDDLASRVSVRPQVTRDGHRAYLNAMDAAFGGEVDYAMLVKLYGAAP